MSNEFLLNAEIRSDAGKGASRRLRRLQDRVPASSMVAKPSRRDQRAARAEKNPGKRSVLQPHPDPEVDGKDVQAVLRDLQRHPAKGVPTHADFLRVDKTKITMNVPLHFINEAGSIGVKQGGEIQHNISEVEVSCLPQDLPEFIEVDMAEVEMNAIVRLSDLKLPKGVELTQRRWATTTTSRLLLSTRRKYVLPSLTTKKAAKKQPAK